MNKTGKIIPNGVSLEKHEYRTILFLTEQGLDIELVPRSNQPGVRTPDAIISGEPWEFKSPRGKGRWLLENTLQKAVRQSPNVIIDLQRIQIHQTKCLQELEKQFYKSKQIRKLRIITKNHKIIDFSK